MPDLAPHRGRDFRIFSIGMHRLAAIPLKRPAEFWQTNHRYPLLVLRSSGGLDQSIRTQNPPGTFPFKVLLTSTAFATLQTSNYITDIESRDLIPADAPLFIMLLLCARPIGFTTHSFDVSWRADHYGCINAINIFGLPTLQS